MNYYKKIAFILFIFLFSISIARADDVVDLKNKINDKNDAINRLQTEIDQYQKDIDALGKEKDSLSNTLKSLDISKKKLQASTKVTQDKIARTNLEIRELSLQIGDKSDRIIGSKDVISKSLSNINQINSNSIVENILGQKSFSDLWKTSDELIVLQANMQSKIKDLTNLKSNLEDNKKLTEKKKAELISLTNDLKSQTKIIADTVLEKNSILKETKNTEANYNKLLLTKKFQKENFEREVSALENALKIAIDPKSIPSSGAGILKYPLDKIRITQYFGNTEFATKNPQIYISGKGHNGIDFAASIGTPVKSALSGTVVGLGNMGRCAYGKWVMVKHENGLSTLYAHLSLITSSIGQTVLTGNTLGYSGSTGIATGPHLHFGVYATEGIRIQTISSSCGRILYPLTDPKAYLNPLSYL